MIAAAALAGAWAGLPWLASWGAGLPAMKPPGALCLAALGLALLYSGKEQRLAVAIGTVIAVLAAFLLTAALLNLDSGIDRLALRTPVSALRPDGLRLDGVTFRIVHTSTVAFGFAGAALALSKFDRCRLAATALAALAGVIVAFALISYLTGISSLYRAASVAAPPLPTAAGLLCIAFGIIMRIGAMPVLRRPRPLWHHLFALGCAILLPLLLFGAYAEVSIGDAELDENGRRLMHGARALSADIDRQILSEIERLQALAASPSLRHGDFPAFQRQAEASLALRQSGNIMLVDRNMRQLVNTWTPYGSPMEMAVIPEPVEQAFATGKPQFTDLFIGPKFIGPKTKEVMFAIVLPVDIDGERRYALVRSVGQRALAELVAAENLPPGWRAAIANAGGHVLAQTSPPAASRQAGQSQEANRESNQGIDREGGETGMSLPPAQPEEGVLEASDAKGRQVLEGYAHSDLTGWNAVMWEPKAQLEAPVRALWSTLGWLALVSVGVVIGLALWLGRIIARSVRLAAGEAAKLGDGAAPRAVETPIAEVNALIADLREAAARREAADERLRDSERQLRLVTDNVPVAIARCDAEGRFTFANKQFLERHRRHCDQILGKRIPEVTGESFAAIERHVAECYAGNAVEFAFETTDEAGAPMFLQGRFVPERRDGEVVGLFGATSDITRLKHAEQRLRASEVTFRQLVDNSPFGIYVVDADFRIMQASTGARRTLDDGVRPLIGRDFAEAIRCLWPEPFATEVISRFRHTLDTGEPYNAPPTTEQRKDTGEVESYDWQIERLTMPDGRFGVVCHYYDLSERQRYEAALRESEATFRAMFDSSAVGKIEIETQTGRFVRANAAMCRFVGYSEAELLGRTVFDITHPDDRDSDREALRRMDAGTLPVFDKEKRYISKDGRIVWARVTANTIRDEAGRPVRNTAVIQDLNERKRAEQELETSRTRLQLALDAAQLGWFQYDPVRRSGRGDARFNEILDLTTEDTPLDVVMGRLHPDDREKAMASLAASLNPADPQPVMIELRIRLRDGAVRWVEIHGLACFEGAGLERRAASLIGTVQDITERKQHEEQTQLLMREVNHRAKNMLSVVDAIAHQTATRSPEDFLVRFSERIQALSANQDLLVRNDWKGVGIADLVRAQMAHFADLIGSRIVVDGPALRLQAASAQAIGLALHELATNAGKYGALSADTGGVHIRWWTEGDAFHMSWTESGGPPVLPPKRRGFGTIVMEVMAGRTVGGKVDLDYAPSGVRWRLTCPAGSALERPEHQSSAATRISRG